MPVLPAIAIGVAAVSTGYSIYAGERANKQSKKAAAAEKARSDLQAARQKREAIRGARIAYASSQQSAENQGVSLSSASQGGLASITSQLEANLSFLDQYKVYTDQASAALQSQQTWQNRAQTADAVGGLAMNVAGNADAITRVFKPRSGGS